MFRSVRTRPNDKSSDVSRHDGRYELLLVAYRSRDLVERMLSELPQGVPVVVVDNSHDVDGLSSVVAGRDRARYIDGPGRGFAAGANAGVRTSEYEIFVIASPDSSPTIDQLDELVDELDADSALAAASTNLVLPDGRIDLGVGGWEPTVRRAAVHAAGLHKVFPRAGLWAAPEPGRAIDVDWLGGACMAMRRSMFLELGCFDESYFVYGEDVEFGRRIRDAGLGQLIRTDLVVRHLEAGSGDGKTRMLRHRGASMTHYIADHNPPRVVRGIQLALTIGYLPRIVVAALRGRRGQAREHGAYLHGLWRGAPSENGD